MKVVVHSSNDPDLSEAEMALCVIARQMRVTSAVRFGRSVVSPGRTPMRRCAYGRPGISTRLSETV